MMKMITNDEVEISWEEKKLVFRAVGQNNDWDLLEKLKDIKPKVWLKWKNGWGDTLLSMAESRKKDKALHTLRKIMGVWEFNSQDKILEPNDNVWVFRDLGEPPEQATVKQVERVDEDDPKSETRVYVQFWDSKQKDEYVPAARCRVMLRNDYGQG